MLIMRSSRDRIWSRRIRTNRTSNLANDLSQEDYVSHFTSLMRISIATSMLGRWLDYEAVDPKVINSDHCINKMSYLLNNKNKLFKRKHF